MARIARIEHFLVPPRWLFVRIECDDGSVGWGEASLEGHAEAVAGALDAARDRLIGHDADRIEDAWQMLYRLGFYRGGPVLMSAISGIDMALWDLRGRALGVPVHDLLGGRVRDSIRVYAWIGGDRPSDVAAAALTRKAQGFDAIKMNGSEEMEWLASPSAVDAAVERLAMVRETGMDVGIDFHGRVHKPVARRLVEALAPLGPLFVEEVLLGEHPEALAQIAAQSTVPLAMGERLYSRWDFKPFFERAVIDVAQPDLAHAGGISEGRRIAAMAEAYDVALAPHCPLGPLALAACFQVAATTPNFVIQEISLGIHYNQADADLLTYLSDPEVLTVRNGRVAVPRGPGLGVTIDEARVRDAARVPHRWRNPVWRGTDGSLREW
ncbi:galactonate dehydratase [Sphingomonas sp. SORGH_AS_0879]|uniref:galactonate dehydratase n=1 Tax=Sphingomonas sp. SORGH_AS_0879 TaxID=3041790 RepID=UPI002784943C|nr:galactonate dehydratase [Sphingomonas sp. SORGH_AS_0879]MDQ1231884.1 galactonate dehydratase [Sphingomonas sp. SORGH_AS_0879]